MLPAQQTISASEFDAALPQLPDRDAVFLVWAGHRSAYLAKTSMLRRRLERVLRPAAGVRRALNLHGVATQVDYWITGSRLESALVHYALAKRHYPDSYRKMIKLRMPSYVRLNLEERFPRTSVTSRLGRDASIGTCGGTSIYYGPFRTRAEAEQFEAGMLDLFQLRRCLEDLTPAENHPGCMYGEMNACLRPCQQAVGPEEYRTEANRVASFLTANGKPLIETISSARDRLSEEMNFEAAAREHKRLEQVNAALALRGELACEIGRLHGVAVASSANPGTVKLWFIHAGCWLPPQEFSLISNVSLDHRLRELAMALPSSDVRPQDRQEHLALLARWFYSSWRDGEWIGFDSLERLPYRKLVRAINRVAGASAPAPPRDGTAG